MQPKCFFGFFCLYVFTRLGQRLAIWNFLSLASMPKANMVLSKTHPGLFSTQNSTTNPSCLNSLALKTDLMKSRLSSLQVLGLRGLKSTFSSRSMLISSAPEPKGIFQLAWFENGVLIHTDDVTWFCCLLYLVHVGSSHHKVPHNRFVDPLKFL